jgi:hypothetical protein
MYRELLWEITKFQNNQDGISRPVKSRRFGLSPEVAVEAAVVDGFGDEFR